ncbi:MAG: NUDIX domain-containing protein [Patescibacteria group bacterium]|nr:NUDIX domain-containing protein [Patescibacteria group bacterium]MCL5095367.1 NUDIX domain-containing protein [Patescibacteria group bacterium]
MKMEISAGGVIYTQKGPKKIKILLLLDKNNHWTFPKGLIEKGEEKIEAARRETKEEVGLQRLKMKVALSPIKYWYKWKEQIVRKTVYYFLFEGDETEKLKPQEEEGIKEVKWVSLEKTFEIIGYPKTNEPILKEVKQQLL